MSEDEDFDTSLTKSAISAIFLMAITTFLYALVVGDQVGGTIGRLVLPIWIVVQGFKAIKSTWGVAKSLDQGHEGAGQTHQLTI